MIVIYVPEVPYVGDIEVIEGNVQRVERNSILFKVVDIVWLHKLVLRIFEGHVELIVDAKKKFFQNSLHRQ